MNTIEKILEKLLKECSCYDEDALRKKMERWPGKNSRLNALYNIGLNKKCFTEDEVAEQEAFLVLREQFKDLADFMVFVESLNFENKEKFLEISHFYHSWCKHPDLYDVLDTSFKLIVMTSAIEALMSDIEYKEFYDWLCADCDQGLIAKAGAKSDFKKQIKVLWEEYKKTHGATKKVKIFFEKYVNQDNRNQLLRGFKALSKGSVNFNQVVGFLYAMRSDFVHKAEIAMLAAPGATLGHVIDGRPFSIKISIDAILSIFEQGLVEYFKNSVHK